MEEIDLRQLFEMFWNKKGTILLITVICMLVGFIAKMYFVKPEYTSSTTLVLTAASNESGNTDTAITTTDVTLNSKLVSTYSELIKSKNIIRTVISNLNIDIGEEELRRTIDVNSVKNTELIQITVTNRDPVLACEIANEIANVFMNKIKDFYKIENVQIVDKAEIETEPSNINYKKDIIIFTGIGLMIAMGYVFILNMFDTTIKSIEDVEAITKLPILSTIPVYIEEEEQRSTKGGKK